MLISKLDKRVGTAYNTLAMEKEAPMHLKESEDMRQDVREAVLALNTKFAKLPYWQPLSASGSFCPFRFVRGEYFSEQSILFYPDEWSNCGSVISVQFRKYAGQNLYEPVKGQFIADHLTDDEVGFSASFSFCKDAQGLKLRLDYTHPEYLASAL
ncbi:MAG TPA: hypothetical protein VFX17_01170 [Patescibacteria group bacterium]|nr:hypothetical protein [Patescibacteria group bacterium]